MKLGFWFGTALTLAAAGSSASAQTASRMDLPPACQAAAQASGQAQMMDKMHSQMADMMKSGMQGAATNDTQKALHQAMMDMNGPMMRAMMAKDADVAWVCSMIPHHQGAIAMAKAGLLGADDAESKKLAEETIKENERGLAKLVAWVEKHASREGRNDTGGSMTKK